MEELFLYYPNLLIVQYNNLPRAKATIELFTYLMFVNLIMLQIQNAFDWKTAVGNQLDIIGKWVGVSRSYQGLLFWNKTFLSYPSWDSLTPTDETDSLQHGYSDYNTFDTDTGGTLTYKDIGFVEQALNDDDFRVVIGLKIIKNSINHTAKNIDEAIWEYFNEQVYTTWDDFEVTYHYPESMNTIMEVCKYKNVLPAPTGVAIELRTIT